MSGSPVRRVVFLVLDGVGAGALPDAAAYGDADADTLGNLSRLLVLRLPTLQRFGLGNVVAMRSVPPCPRPEALPALLAERSPGKDSTTGHWEHMGLVRTQPFPTYPDGFPAEVLDAVVRTIGRPVIGNRVASGTEIIQELGAEHLRTGCPILYTSQDSVFQLAAHVDLIPPRLLYEWCTAIRKLLVPPHEVGRVIARPFEGPVNALVRTKGRRDFSVPPTGPTYLDVLRERGVEVTGVGKVVDLFAGRGFSTCVSASGNRATLRAVSELVEEGVEGLIFANLIDFDMEWGHRNDAEGFAAALQELDAALGELTRRLGVGDALLITADHGCDPTTPSTEHSREYAPLLLWMGREPKTTWRVKRGHFSDTGATTFHLLTGEAPPLCGVDLRSLPECRTYLRKTRSSPSVAPAVSVPRATPSRGKMERAARIAAAVLHASMGPAPGLAVVLGSGLDAFVEGLTVSCERSFSDIPGWINPGVSGHKGAILLGRRGSKPLVVLSGRLHLYEGCSPSQVALPVWSLKEWGVEHVVLTCAAGGVSRACSVGTAVEVGSILDFQRFVFGRLVPRRLRVSDTGVVYAAMPGPHYETIADVEVLRHLGADVVGMSCAVEVEAARQAGLSCRVISVVTNMAAEADTRADGPRREVDLHTEVVRVASRAGGALADLIFSS